MRIAGRDYSVDPVMIGRMVDVVAGLDEVRIPAMADWSDSMPAPGPAQRRSSTPRPFQLAVYGQFLLAIDSGDSSRDHPQQEHREGRSHRGGAAPGLRCYTEPMPTRRPRHTITETDEIAAALRDAALAWPELRGDRTALLRRLLDAGRNAVHHDAASPSPIRAAAGAGSGAYPRDARAALLAEWPE